MALPRYRKIADDLRAAIYQGQYQPGDLLPARTALMATYGVAQETVAKAHRQLETEGLIDVVRRGGTRVRRQPERRLITRDREVYRDEIGYFFDKAAQNWRALAPIRIAREPAPPGIARHLRIPPGTVVLVRDRRIGDPDTGKIHQLTTSYLPLELVEQLPVLEAVDTGPGGIYDRLEEAGHGPLQWHEYLTARAPTAAEHDLLELAPGTPIQQITRTSTDPAGLVCETNAIRLDADRVEIRYPLHRNT